MPKSETASVSGFQNVMSIPPVFVKGVRLIIAGPGVNASRDRSRPSKRRFFRAFRRSAALPPDDPGPKSRANLFPESFDGAIRRRIPAYPVISGRGPWPLLVLRRFADVGLEADWRRQSLSRQARGI